MSSIDASAGPPEPDDLQLMRRVQGGHVADFGLLVQRHQQALLNFFLRLGAYQDADDLVQITFLRLWHYRAKYRPTAQFTTFLYTLARHAWFDALRGRRRHAAAVERLAREHDGTHDGGVGRLRLRLDVQAALRQLPVKMREALVLSVYQGLHYHEVAAVLGIPEGTVKSRVFLALRRLKEIFDADKLA